MAPQLYMVPPSPPVRAVQLTAKRLNVDLDLKIVDMMNGEHLKPEFLKLNPQHTVPVLVDDDGFVLWESHAIMIYLVEKYGKDDALYPKDLKVRAIVNQLLHFDSSVLFPRGFKLISKIRLEHKKSVDQVDIDSMNEAYGFLDKMLEGRKWAAGDSLTIADFSLISLITTMDYLVPVDAKKFANVAGWIKNVQKIPEYEVNRKGLEAFVAFIKTIMA